MSTDQTSQPLPGWLTPRAAPSLRPSERSSRWSYRLFSVLGIPIRVHVTFLILLSWVVVDELQQRRGLQHVLIELLLVLAVFGCIVFHELSHALTARRFGVRTREITLLPIGGVARMEQLPERPRQELLVAIAGPIASLVLAAVCGMLLVLTRSAADLESIRVTNGPFLARLLWVNVLLAAFNLLPAFPMDGGRVLRAGLCLVMPRSRATAIAAAIGQAIAVPLGIIGFMHNGMLVFVAIFIWIAGQQEAASVRLRAALRDMPVGAAMLQPVMVLSPEDPVRIAAHRAVTSLQPSFPVVANQQVVGLVTHDDLIQALSQAGGDTQVGQVMRHELATANETDMLETAVDKLADAPARVLIVLREDEPVGLLTPASLEELLAIASASKSNAKQR